jgi:hypothetical protein
MKRNRIKEGEERREEKARDTGGKGGEERVEEKKESCRNFV